MRQKKETNKVKILVVLALLVALNLVLGRPPLTFLIWSNKIGFAFVPVFVAAVLYGPVAAGIVGGMGDLLGAVLFPVGAYFPGFTATAVVGGLVFGLLLGSRPSLSRIAAASLINQLVLGLLVNTYWITLISGASFSGLMLSRVIQCMLMLVLEIGGMSLLSRTLLPKIREVLV